MQDQHFFSINTSLEFVSKTIADLATVSNAMLLFVNIIIKKPDRIVLSLNSIHRFPYTLI